MAEKTLTNLIGEINLEERELCDEEVDKELVLVNKIIITPVKTNKRTIIEVYMDEENTIYVFVKGAEIVELDRRL